MSTSTPDSPPELSKQPAAAAQKGSAPSVDPFVDKQIERTRRLVKLTDLLTSIGKLTVGFIVLLLIAAVGEHWLVPGGYGTNERMAFWAVAVIGGGVYFAHYIFPLLTHRVNSLYAADELEREAPELKNSLVNLLQLREDGHTTGAIQKTLERQAAQRLANAKPQGVDQSHLIHVGYALVAVLAVTAIYVVFSPKDFFTTAGRVLSPWSDLAAPSRVKIESLTPGDTTLAQGEQLEITLSILGLQGEEKAELIYSSDDGRIIERHLALIPSSESSIGYSIQLPGPTEPLGLQSSISYRIEAGDARTRNYQADVLTTPAIAPVSIHFEYPAYTGLEDRHVDQGSDLRGIEGTKVTLTAEANLEVESAQIDFDADGRPDIRMESNGKQATAEFTLKRRNTNSGVAPYISSYVIRYTTTDGQTNSSPPKYPLEVFADLPPEVSILNPEEEEATISLDEVVPIQVEARDPDFALKEVWLIAQKNGRTILREQMLKLDVGTNGHQGRFLDEYKWIAREIGLQGGERIDYWAEALDVRDPSQRALSKRQVFLIRPDKNPEQENQSEEGGNEGNQSGDPSEGESGQEENSEQNQSGEGNQSNQGGEGQSSDGQEGEASEQEPSEGQQGSEGSNENADGIQGEGDPNSESQNNGGEGGNPSNNEQEQNQEGERSSGEGNRDADPNGEGQENQGGEPGNYQEQVQSNDDPVADDGSDDGAAFDRIQEHLAKKQEDAAEDRDRQQVEGESDPNENSDGEGQNAADPEAGEPDQGNPRDNTGADPERDPRNSESESESGEGKSSDSQSSESTESSPSGRNSKPNDDPREGTGSSGENQAADDGTGQSGDRGEGESTGREGNQQSGENKNSSEKTEGEGSDTREGDGDHEGRGAKPKEKDSEDGKGQSSSGSPSDSNNSDNQSRESDNGELTEQDPNREGNPNGPRRGGDRDVFDPNKNFASEGELGEDEANLEYARKRTELVLNELEDQLQNNQVDEELLDKLGWSEEDLREFVERWQSRKQKAEQNPGKGSQELNDALRSLGLQQKDRRINGSSNNSTDSMRDLQQGNRSTIPPALREKLKRYNRGINNSE